MPVYEELGFFGNVWVRQNWLLKAGDTAGGHLHHHDHVSLLVKGSVEVEVDGSEPKRFKSPTFILIKKNFRHKITALEDDTVFYCVFALRDVDGNVVDIADVANLPNYPNGGAPEYTGVIE